MLKQKDAADLIHAMIKEANNNEKRNHWEVVHCWDKPPGVKTILSIWISGTNAFPMSALINTRRDFVLMEECNNMGSTTGKHTLQQ